MKTRNIKEFKKLILRYENITIEEIEEKDSNAKELTGFGRKDTCTLCRVFYDSMGNFEGCGACVWHRIFNNHIACLSGKNEETYDAINHIDYHKPKMLLDAYRARAIYMRSVLKKLRIKQP